MIYNKDIFVSKDTAIMLREAGFDLKCHTRIPYNIAPQDNSCSGFYEDCKDAKNWNADYKSLSAPTMDVVLNWIKEKYGIEILMQPIDDNGNVIWNGCIGESDIYKGNDNYQDSLNKTVQKCLNNINNTQKITHTDMKDSILKALKMLIAFPIGLVLFLLIFVFATLLWPIYFMGKAIESLIKLFVSEYSSNAINDMLEFIFAIYGFSALFILLPLSIYDDTLS